MLLISHLILASLLWKSRLGWVPVAFFKEPYVVIEVLVSETWKVRPKDGAAENNVGNHVDGGGLLRSCRSLVPEDTFQDTALGSRTAEFHTQLLRTELCDLWPLPWPLWASLSSPENDCWGPPRSKIIMTFQTFQFKSLLVTPQDVVTWWSSMYVKSWANYGNTCWSGSMCSDLFTGIKIQNPKSSRPTFIISVLPCSGNLDKLCNLTKT